MPRHVERVHVSSNFQLSWGKDHCKIKKNKQKFKKMNKKQNPEILLYTVIILLIYLALPLIVGNICHEGTERERHRETLEIFEKSGGGLTVARISVVIAG